MLTKNSQRGGNMLRVLSRLVIVGCDSVITTNNLYRETLYRQ